MYYSDLHRALTQSLIDANLGVEIAHENATFNPDAFEIYLEPTNILGLKNQMAKKGFGDQSGLYQISIYVKNGTSVGAAYAVADALAAYYVDGMVLTSNNQEVRVNNAYLDPYLPSRGWKMFPFTIEFKSNRTDH